MRLLCVDDDLHLLKSLKRLFEHHGWAVETAVDSRGASSLANEPRFDAFIVDMKLPDTSGLELVQQLRQASINTPVIIFTAYPSAREAVTATRLGLEYLVKQETKPSQLVAAVQDLVSQSDGATDGLDRLLRQLSREAANLLAADFRRYEADLATQLIRAGLGIADFMAGAAALRTLQARSAHRAGFRTSLQLSLARASQQRTAAARLKLEEVLRDAAAASPGLTPSVPTVSSHGLTTDEFDRRLRREFGCSWRELRLAAVMRGAVQSLGCTDEHVAQIAYAAGYEFHSAFDRDFRGTFGLSPRSFRVLLQAGR